MKQRRRYSAAKSQVNWTGTLKVKVRDITLTCTISALLLKNTKMIFKRTCTYHPNIDHWKASVMLFFSYFKHFVYRVG